MGLEVSRIFALAEGSFHIRNTKKATLGTSSKMSQNRTLRQRDEREGDHAKLSAKNVLYSSTVCHANTWTLRCPRTGLADICEAC